MITIFLAFVIFLSQIEEVRTNERVLLRSLQIFFLVPIAALVYKAWVYKRLLKLLLLNIQEKTAAYESLIKVHLNNKSEKAGSALI